MCKWAVLPGVNQCACRGKYFSLPWCGGSRGGWWVTISCKPPAANNSVCWQLGWISSDCLQAKSCDSLAVHLLSLPITSECSLELGLNELFIIISGYLLLLKAFLSLQANQLSWLSRIFPSLLGGCVWGELKGFTLAKFFHWYYSKWCCVFLLLLFSVVVCLYNERFL